MEKIKKLIESYIPFNAQEDRDKQVMLEYCRDFDNLLTRENSYAHFSATAFIINETHDKLLMIYHNIFQSFSWTGGHNDGDDDCAYVAEKEAREETGIESLTLLCPEPIALDILPVWGHMKRGSYVSAHQHLNFTYLFEAREDQPLRIKPDENSDVQWIAVKDLETAVSEKEMLKVYAKILQRLETDQYKNNQITA